MLGILGFCMQGFHFFNRKLRDGYSPNNGSDSEFMAFADRFTTLKEVSHEIEKEGIESCGLIFGKSL